jgi:hypothetical protein
MDPNGDGDPSDGIDGWRLDVANEVGTGFWADKVMQQLAVQVVTELFPRLLARVFTMAVVVAVLLKALAIFRQAVKVVAVTAQTLLQPTQAQVAQILAVAQVVECKALSKCPEQALVCVLSM